MSVGTGTPTDANNALLRTEKKYLDTTILHNPSETSRPLAKFAQQCAHRLASAWMSARPERLGRARQTPPQRPMAARL